MLPRTAGRYGMDGSLDRLIEGLTRYSERQWVQMQAMEGGWQKVYGPVLVFRKLWEQLGLDKLLTDLQTQTFIQFSLTRRSLPWCCTGCWTRAASGPRISGWRRSTGQRLRLCSYSISTGLWTPSRWERED